VPATTTLGLFALAALALIAIPGPNLVSIAARSMQEGRRAGQVSAADLLTGTAINVAAAAAGLSALIAYSVVATQILVLGAILGTLGFAATACTRWPRARPRGGWAGGGTAGRSRAPCTSPSAPRRPPSAAARTNAFAPPRSPPSATIAPTRA
jgi:hypothetical protein